MPSFVSHMVMANDVYNRLNDKHIDLDDMITYSLGGDLCKYAKCRYDSHHKDMDKFIYEMANYIKDNSLMNDSHAMGVLYGHICHYVMDKTIHPLVRNVDKACLKNKHNHTLIEIYYDNYLVNKRYHISKRKYLTKRILVGKKNDEVKRIIDQVYLNIYDIDNVSKYYHFNLFLYKVLRNIYILLGDKLTNQLFGVNGFIKRNKQINLIMINNDDLDSLYRLSVDMAYEYIKKINMYLKIS